MPQAGHGLSGRNYGFDGEGKAVPVAPIPNGFDRFAPARELGRTEGRTGLSVVVSAGDKSLPLCSYPAYPRYKSGPPAAAESYGCDRRP